EGWNKHEGFFLFTSNPTSFSFVDFVVEYLLLPVFFKPRRAHAKALVVNTWSEGWNKHEGFYL
ncbi:MAG TPA: hypothetical protein PKL30_14115, partial [Leptospiraceae bacterium]|nr:hypothetical protein [Leptospiraceae bacterium]